MKRYFFLLLWLMASLQGIAYIGETFEIDGITYQVEYENSYDEFSIKYGNDCGIVSSSANLSGSITIPPAVEHNGRHYKVGVIGEEAFKNRTNITALYTPSGYEFYDSEFQRTVVVEGLRGIGPRAFENCTGLTDIDLGALLVEYENDGIYISPDTFKGCTNIKRIHSSTKILNISAQMFEDSRESLESLYIGGSGCNIGENAFMYFTKLHSISLPGVECINRRAFEGCKNLRDIQLSESNVVLWPDAFAYCINLESIFLPKYVSIWEDANPFYMFSDIQDDSINPRLREIIVDPENENLTSVDGVLYNKSLTKLISFPPASPIGDYTLPETVKIIPYSSAFLRCDGLNSVTIPGRIRQIGDLTFYRCRNLTSVNLPESLQSIEFSAFESCRLLNSIDIPDSVKIIREDAFRGCSSLQSVHLPAHLEKIERDAFYGSGLTSVDIPEGTELLGTNAFLMCYNLGQIILPASLEAYYHIPTYGDPSYNYMVFHTYLPPYGTEHVNDVYYKAEDPVELNEYFFANDIYEYATLHVPAEAVEKAAVTLPWSKFQKIVAHDFSSDIQDVIVDQIVPTEVYNLSGVKVSDNTESLPAGIYIVRQGNEVKKIAIR